MSTTSDHPVTDNEIVASLAAKLDALPLTEAERQILAERLSDDDVEVSGFSFASFGDLLGRSTTSGASLSGSAGSPDIFKDPKAPIAGTAGNPDIFKAPNAPLSGTAGSPEI